MFSVFPLPERAFVRAVRVDLAAAVLTLTGAFSAEAQSVGGAPIVTNVSQLSEAAQQLPAAICSIQLEGDVWWVDATKNRLVLSDASGAQALELGAAIRGVKTGQRILIEGIGSVARRGAFIQVGARGPIVDNNGEHDLIEKSGAVFLSEGLNPFRLEWFNGVEGFGLELDYEGPDLPRQRVPDSAFAHSISTTDRLQAGLNYEYYEGSWQVLPEFDDLDSVATGSASNLDLSVLPRAENVALVFSGQLKVSNAGIYTFHLRSDDGSRLFVGTRMLSVRVTGVGIAPTPQRIAIGQTLLDDAPSQWIEVEGRVTRVSSGQAGVPLKLSAGSATVGLILGETPADTPPLFLNQKVRVAGFCLPAVTSDGETIAGAVLVPDIGGIILIAPQQAVQPQTVVTPEGATLPVLSTAVEVHQLKREQAERGYPVRFRGVVTSVLPERQAFTLQDATRGLYVVDLSANRSGPPRVGEFLEVEGVTDPSLFAPIVNAHQVRSLGLGQLPEPIHPTWDQLMNGSLDAQFVEMQGIVTTVRSNGVSLLTREGVILVELRINDLELESLKDFENGLVRIRGCLFATWDYLTHQVVVGDVRIYSADLHLEESPPKDLFESPAKTASELLLFDPRASAFQRVKVSGQVVHVRGTEHFLMDQNRGLRFLLTSPMTLEPGDAVDVVGFPELFGHASPILREAVARKTGHRELPEPRSVASEDLARALLDSTVVRVEGLLVDLRRAQTEDVLEIQSGVRSFVARVGITGERLDDLPSGTRMELLGVYAAQGGSSATATEVGSFELLVNSPQDIRVLARPPWWTLKRLLVIVGVLACVLAATVLWLTQLHRQVEQRSAELATQIEEREQVEHQRAIEQERARIAQDLHDELGSGITEISMLAARAKSANASGEKRSDYLDEAWMRARAMVTSLDEIVWAMDPLHDSLGSLVSYFSLYADRFLGLAGITWRLESPSGSGHHVLNSRHRYQLFLAFKEALNNVVRHSRATEVRLRIQVEASEVRLAISDNGRGLPDGERTEAMSGVTGMRARIERLGGRFELTSETGKGTTVRFVLP